MLLRCIAPELHHLWSQDSSKRGDPSVCDLFHYGECQLNTSTGPTTKQARRPGIFTCKHVSAAQVEGLELLNREWVGENRIRANLE